MANEQMPDWVAELQHGEMSQDDDDIDCQTLFMQRMLVRAMHLKLQAEQADTAGKAFTQHLDQRVRDLEEREKHNAMAERRFEDRLRSSMQAQKSAGANK